MIFTQLLGGTNPGYAFFTEDNETGSVPDHGTHTTAWTAFTGAAQADIVTELGAHKSKDSIKFHVNITVPDDASGQKSDVLAFVATKS